MSKELDELRLELDTIDRELMAVAARRMRVVRGIGALKAGNTRAVFDRQRERAVFARARRNAEAAGLPSEVGERLLHTLVEAGHGMQTQAAAGKMSEPRKVLILGGLGAMGRLLGDTLALRGHHIDAYDRDDPRDLAQTIAQVDVVLIAVPMALAAKVARLVCPMMRSGQLLCDINSLKEEVCGIFETECKSEALGLHPMFGPSVGSLRRQKVVVCHVHDGPQSEWLVSEFGRLGTDIIETDARTHDRMMAVVQVLVHFHTIVMGEALRRTEVPVADSLRFTSPIYRLELAVVGRLFTQDAELYASIEMDNPHGSEMRQLFLDAAQALHEAIESGDRARFTEMFSGVTAYFDDFGPEAMRVSDAIIDMLVERA